MNVYNPKLPVLRLLATALLLSTPAAVFAGAVPEGARLAQQHACVACHAADKPLVGPSYRDVARKYAGDGNAPATLTAKVRAGGSGVWGAVPMPPHAQVPEAEVQKIVAWVLAGAPTE